MIHRTPFAVVTGFMYLLIAFAMWIHPHASAMGWWRDGLGVNTAYMLAVFAASGLTLLLYPRGNGSNRLLLATFILLPMVLYTLHVMAWTLAIGSVSFFTAVCYLGSLTALLLTLSLERIGKIEPRRVISVAMLCIGIALLAAPNVGAAGWLANRWHVPFFGVLLGLAMCASFLWSWLLPARDVRWFVVQTTPIFYYVTGVLRYSSSNEAGGLVGVITSLLFFAGLLYAYVRFEPDDEIPHAI